MRKVYELKNQRAALLEEAEKALNSEDMEAYNTKMKEVEALNQQIGAAEALEAEQNRYEGITNIPGFTGGTTSRDDKEYKDAFFYAITNGITPKNGKGNEKVAILYNALTESGGSPTGADGGFLVPVSFNNMIIELRRQLVSLSQYVTVETVATPTGWRTIDVNPTAGFTKVDEMGEIPKDDQPKFTKVTYSLEKYGLIVPVSSELLDDNTAGLEAYLARWFAKKGIITENKQILAALDTLTAKNLTVGKEVKALTSVLNKDLDPAISMSAVIVTNQSGFDYLCGLEDANGRSLIQPDPTTGQPRIFRSHSVVVLSDAELPNRTVATAGETKGDYYPVYVGDLKAFVTLFSGKTLEVASTNIGGNAWTTDSVEVRGIMRMDTVKMDDKAVVKREIFVKAAA